MIVIADHDDAGRRWAERLAGLLSDHDIRPSVLTPASRGQDLNGWAQIDPTWADQITSVPIETCPEHLLLDDSTVEHGSAEIDMQLNDGSL